MAKVAVLITRERGRRRRSKKEKDFSRDRIVAGYPRGREEPNLSVARPVATRGDNNTGSAGLRGRGAPLRALFEDSILLNCLVFVFCAEVQRYVG